MSAFFGKEKEINFLKCFINLKNEVIRSLIIIYTKFLGILHLYQSSFPIWFISFDNSEVAKNLKSEQQYRFYFHLYSAVKTFSAQLSPLSIYKMRSNACP